MLTEKHKIIRASGRNTVILIGLGANLPSAEFGSPLHTLEAALKVLEADGISVGRRSRWFRSAPVPPSNQPWFVNGVAELCTELGPEPLLQALHAMEARFGRRRSMRNEARILDLDLLAYGDLVTGPSNPVQLPHPRLAERAFVVLPLAETFPDWIHPISGLAARQLVKRLPQGQRCEPLA